VVDRIRTLEDERLAIGLWLQIYKERATHEEWEDAAYSLHKARQQEIVRQLEELRGCRMPKRTLCRYRVGVERVCPYQN
jgi:hypothetical protein